MPQVKDFTAKQELKLDCGHSIKKGEPFQVTSVYTCAKEASWPLRILLSCLRANQKQQKEE